MRAADAFFDTRMRMQGLNGAELFGAPERIGARFLRQQQLRALDIEKAAEINSHANRPGQQREVEREAGRDLVEQRKRIVSLAVDLVDEGDDRDVAQPAYFEQLARLALDPFAASITIMAASTALSVR